MHLYVFWSFATSCDTWFDTCDTEAKIVQALYKFYTRLSVANLFQQIQNT